LAPEEFRTLNLVNMKQECYPLDVEMYWSKVRYTTHYV